MALTRPLLEQINTDSVSFSDPLISINSTGQQLDTGILINTDGGTSPNVALIWSQANSRVTLGTTTAGIGTSGNVAFSSLATLELGSVRMNGIDVTVDGTGKLTVGGSEVTGGVESVNSMTGNVVITAANVGAQEILVSGTNIKTINGTTILGSGDLVIAGGVESVNGLTGNVTLDTDDIAEGTANLFFSNARAVSAIQSDLSWHASDWDTAFSWGDHATAGYQAQLVSNVNIKTVNGQTLLGSGDITAGGGGTVTDDTTTDASYYPAMYSVTTGEPAAVYVSSTKLYFNPSTGTLNATVLNTLSDERKKKNVEVITDSVSTVNKLTGVEFEWVDTGEKSSGVIAQQLELVLPNLVSTAENGEKSVNYLGIIGYLIESIKELDARVRELESNV